MKRFSAPSAKPTWLYSNAPLITELYDFYTDDSSPRGCASLCKLSGVPGAVKVSGTPALKQSQTYTREFGEALAAVYHRHVETLRGNAPSLHARPPADESADDAELALVLAHLDYGAQQ